MILYSIYVGWLDDENLDGSLNVIKSVKFLGEGFRYKKYFLYKFEMKSAGSINKISVLIL